MRTQQTNHAFEASIISNSQYRRFCSLPACRELNEEECIELFTCFDSCRFSVGTDIYKAGTPSSQIVYLITEGWASVTPLVGTSYFRLGEGDTFGLFSFLDRSRCHSSTVTAATDLELLRIGREQFDMITLEEPELGSRLLRFMFHLLSNKALNLESEYSGVFEYGTAGHH